MPQTTESAKDYLSIFAMPPLALKPMARMCPCSELQSIAYLDLLQSLQFGRTPKIPMHMDAIDVATAETSVRDSTIYDVSEDLEFWQHPLRLAN